MRREKIFVGVRLRPLSEAEANANERTCWEVQSDGKTLAFRQGVTAEAPSAHSAAASPLPSGVLVDTAGGDVASRNPPPVAFDAAFSPQASNEDVYRAAAAGLVAGACVGYNATVFAYGQTGSGKTHTMAPLMASACTDIFAHIDANPEREFLLRVSAVEIYNEEVRDLLGPSWPKGPGAVGKGNASNFGPPLKLLDDQVRGIIAEGLTEEGVRSVDHLHAILATVQQRRTVRDTRLNDSSSRSHLIVRVCTESRPNATSGVTSASHNNGAAIMTSTLTFVDLAGSERSLSAGVDDGDRRRQVEGSHINRSLLTLGTVIRLLGSGKKGQHIRFRDSKLTRMLQPALGGNARTAIICTISPSLGQLDNTRSTISFAQHAKRVTTQPQLNQVMDSQTQIRLLEEEISNLKDKLACKSAHDSISEESGTASQLAEELSEKEERLRLTAVQKDVAERQLRNLEKLILRAEPGRKPDMRASWAPESMSKATPENRGSFVGGSLLGNFGGGANRRLSAIQSPYQSAEKIRASGSVTPVDWPGMRNSWNPGSSVYAPTPRMGAGMGRSRLNNQPGRRVGDASGLLLLNCFLSPAVVKHLKTAPTASTVDAAAGAKATAAAEISQLESPSDESAQAALEALQSEVRCMKQTQGGAEDAIKFLQDELLRIEEEKVIGEFLDATKEETISALRTEIERLKSEQAAAKAADSALASLKEKLHAMGARSEEDGNSSSVEVGSVADLALGPEDAGATPPNAHTTRSPHGVEGEGHVLFKTTLRSPSASPQLDSPRASMFLASARMFHGSGGGGGPTPSPLGISNRANKENDAEAAMALHSPSGGVGTGRSVSASVATGFRMHKPKNLQVGDGDSPAVTLYREELCKVKAFKAAAEKDLEQLQEYLEEQREQAERLACQKKMLLNQVLKLEWKLEEAGEAQADLSEQLEAAHGQAEAATEQVKTLEAELQESRALVAELRKSAVMSAPMTPSAPPKVPPLVRVPADVPMSMVDGTRDGWAAPATVGSLLPKIVVLWEELSVPLLHRSRFYKAFRGRELFYYEAEHRRLEHTAARIRAAADGTPRTKRNFDKSQQKAERKLEWEKQWLASQLKWEYEEEDRLKILDAWGVSRDVKKRKVELMSKIWSGDITQSGRHHEGMERSADLVLELHGQDASEGMWEMVFGREAAPARNGGGVGLPIGFEKSIMRSFSTNAVTNTMKAVVKTPMRALTKSPGGWLTPRSKSRTKFLSAPGTPTAGSAVGSPRRDLSSIA